MSIAADNPSGAASPTTPEIVIDVHGLTKSFGGHQVVRNLSMQVKRGTIFGFLGPNGSGKTTTIRMLCGLLTPDEGSGTCLGYDIRTEAAKIKNRVGYMTQRFSLYDDLSVRENLEFVARIYGISRPRAAAKAMIARLGLAGREEQVAGKLSGGWKQRLALGACTLPNPSLLLLDEPTAGVDPKARRDFWSEIHELAAGGLTVLVSTHYMDEAERCHQIAYISFGEVLTRGTVDEVIANSHLTTFTVNSTQGENLLRLAGELTGESGNRNGRAVRDQPACFGPRCRCSRGRDRSLPRATGARLGACFTLARGRVHRSHGSGKGQFQMSIASAIGADGFWRRVFAMLLKELLQLRRDRITLATMISIPLLQLVLFGYAINTTPRYLPTAVLLQELSDVGRSILAALQNTKFFKVTRILHDEFELDDALASGNILFAVEIPAGFERALRRGDHPALLVAADATDPVATGPAIAALSGVVNSALINDRGLPDAGQPLFEIRAHERYNPAALTPLNIVPGLLGTILTLTMLIFTSLSVTRETERGTMESLLAMPITPFEIMLGKIAPYVLVGFVQAALILGAGVLMFGVPIVGNLALLAALTTLFIATNLSFGYTFSTLAQNQLQAIQMSMMFFLPNMMLSGFIFPFLGMPRWAQVVGEWLPLTHYMRIVRAIMLKGATLFQLQYDTLALAALMVFAMAIAVTRFRRTLD